MLEQQSLSRFLTDIYDGAKIVLPVDPVCSWTTHQGLTGVPNQQCELGYSLGPIDFITDAGIAKKKNTP